uniref:BZIP domain-containing protein n=1 Tax=Arion vulgaris TaxID=1028688 RepID=A0A0B7AVT5_9EUPU
MEVWSQVFQIVSASVQDFGEPFDALEGATGGTEYNSSYGEMSDHFSKVSHLSESSNDSGFINQGAFSSSPSSSSSSYAGSPAGSHKGINSSTSSNDTENDLHSTQSVTHPYVTNNHTYNTPPGQVPREIKKYVQKEPSRKGPHSRDQRRAEELKIPLTIEDIIESPVETFNELLTKYKLNEAQLALIRDIRRRGKNKVAAQNCRKRKVGVIFNLTDEMSELQKMRDRLVVERAAMDRERRKMKEKFGHLYTHIFQSLRDDQGEPYDPSLYSLQQSSDGSVFLVPRNLTVNKNSNLLPSSNDSLGSKKRKSFDY